MSASAALPVLVLGSGGFLGQVLVAHLRAGGYHVAEVRGRSHVDLRDAAAFSSYAAAHGPFSFIFFLACEVGGSRYLTDPSSQAAILRHNVQMYETVFPWAARSGTRLLFASSSMRHQRTGAYATIKALGEEYLEALLPPEAGRAVRLFNIYGRERLSARSHVLSDWATQCVMEGEVRSLTALRERRQFLHVHDAAAAMIAVMQHWPTAFLGGPVGAGGGAGGMVGGAADGVGSRTLDITSGRWEDLDALAHRLSHLAQSRLGLPPCPLRVVAGAEAGSAAAPRTQFEPEGGFALHAHWREWLPPARYPAAAPLGAARSEVAIAAAEEGGVALTSRGDGGGNASYPEATPAAGLGWISMDEGLLDLLRSHL